MLSPVKFQFLNSVIEIKSASDWNHPQIPKLWLYNLHYFEDLNSEGAFTRSEWHRFLIARWILENPPGYGVGWDPYPVSVRVINWIKWELAGNKLDDATRYSLAVQVRYLSKRMEWHLLGNHLFVNAKALIFAGCFFQGSEPADWLNTGMAILKDQVPEQILSDGGQFERSPMYHSLALEDMLDLINLFNAYPYVRNNWSGLIDSWTSFIPKMAYWLQVMCHSDGEISFFNDTAKGIALPPAKLSSYAKQLNFSDQFNLPEIIHLVPSGYIRITVGSAVLLIDAAPIGPDYLPGHAHADTLTYELSLNGKRTIVNSGISRYGLGAEREFERSTAAHNTLEIDGFNSSEVWSGFRVARRAYPFDVSVKREGNLIVARASHNGYKRLAGKPVHTRCWRIGEGFLEVIDSVSGIFSEAISRVYFHPAVTLNRMEEVASIQGIEHSVSWDCMGDEYSLETGHFHEEFGLSAPCQILKIKINYSRENPSCRLMLSWK